MKKKIILGLVIVNFLFVFSGCVNNPEKEAEEILMSFFDEEGFPQDIIDDLIFLEFYEEGDYWFYEVVQKEFINEEDEIATFEINKNTKEVEWMSAGGERLSVPLILELSLTRPIHPDMCMFGSGLVCVNKSFSKEGEVKIFLRNTLGQTIFVSDDGREITLQYFYKGEKQSLNVNPVPQFSDENNNAWSHNEIIELNFDVNKEHFEELSTLLGDVFINYVVEGSTMERTHRGSLRIQASP